MKLARSCHWLVTLILLAGCSKTSTDQNNTPHENGPFDKEVASALLKARFEKTGNGLLVEVGKLHSSCTAEYEEIGEVKVSFAPDDANVRAAVKAGYVSAIGEGKDSWTIVLTDKGKAAKKKAEMHRQAKGDCDFRMVVFPVATQELIGITGVTSDSTRPEAEYEWKWGLSELGTALREDGSVYSALTREQRIALRNWISAYAIRAPIPTPKDNEIEKESVAFKKFDDGWRIVSYNRKF